MRLYIIRHAEPDYENNTITPAGHLEAQALSKRFQKIGLDRIFTSPLGRAVDTCRYTSEALGIEPTLLEWTKETGTGAVEYPGFEGRLALFCAHGYMVRKQEKYREISLENWNQYSPFDKALAHEKIEEIGLQSDAFLRTLGFERKEGVYQVLQKENRQKIAVFCHLGFGLAWLSHLLNISPPQVWTGFHLSPSSVTTVLFEEACPGIATPRALSVGDLSHLYAEDLPTSPTGLHANLE